MNEKYSIGLNGPYPENGTLGNGEGRKGSYVAPPA
jgi:hypothetical protein